jgi:hypothetical protein
VLFLLLFTVWQALTVRMALNDVAMRMTSMVDALSEGRAAAADRHLTAAQDEAGKARRHTSGPVWLLGSQLPWIGDDITAVRTVASVSDDLTTQTLPELVAEAGDFGARALKPKDGQFNIRRIGRAEPVLRQGAGDIAEANRRVRDLETVGLLPPLKTPVQSFQEKIAQAAATSEHAAMAAELLPDLLGGEEKRTYLFLFQNNAEIRAQGGMPGAVAIVTAEKGRIQMVRQGGPRDIGTFAEPVVSLTGEERQLFTSRAAIYSQDTVFIPDFARSSEIVSRMWEETNPERIDGVLSFDPVALSYVLRGTGPVELANGTRLQAETAQDYLMRDIYLEEPDNEVQNEIFADTSRRVFDRVVGGGGDVRGLLSGLSQSASERRLMFWSKREAEQERIADSPIAGLLPTKTSPRPDVGVYLNDAAADKLSYYLDYEVDVEATSCTANRQTLDVTVTMTSTVPKGAPLTPSVVGPPTNPTRPGQMLNSMYLYAPVGGYIDGPARVDGREQPVSPYTYRGRDVGALSLYLDRGQKRVITYRIRTGAGETGDPRLITTPAALGPGTGYVSRSAC